MRANPQCEKDCITLNFNSIPEYWTNMTKVRTEFRTPGTDIRSSNQNELTAGVFFLQWKPNNSMDIGVIFSSQFPNFKDRPKPRDKVFQTV